MSDSFDYCESENQEWAQKARGMNGKAFDCKTEIEKIEGDIKRLGRN